MNQHTLASGRRRFAAVFVDGLILGFVDSVASFVLFFIPLPPTLSFALRCALMPLYFIVAHGVWGRTIADYMFRVRVLRVPADEALSISDSIRRHGILALLACIQLLLGIVDFLSGGDGGMFGVTFILAIVLLLWLLCEPWTTYLKSGRSVSDLMSGTIALKKA